MSCPPCTHDCNEGSVWPWEKTDLIKRLLAEETDLTDCAADYIEELVKERDELGRKLNTARYGQPDFAWSIHEEAMADLRAKLAKAVEFLKTMADYNKYVIAPFLAELEKKE